MDDLTSGLDEIRFLTLVGRKDPVSEQLLNQQEKLIHIENICDFWFFVAIKNNWV